VEVGGLTWGGVEGCDLGDVLSWVLEEWDVRMKKIVGSGVSG
jgi:hypothetical protein